MKNYLIKKIIKQSGQSILEIIVALAIFSLVSASLSSLIMGSFLTLNRSIEFAQASGFADEGSEAIKNVRDRNWEELNLNEVVIDSSTGRWIINSGPNELIQNKYLRTINFFPVFRDADGRLAASSAPFASLDAGSKKVRIKVEWNTSNGITDYVERNFYITNWK